MKILIYSIYIFSFFSLQAFAMSQKPSEKLNKVTNKVSGKSRSHARIEIKTLDNGNGDLTLSASISPQQTMESATVQWKVPDHLKVISGGLKSIVKLKSGEQNDFSIVLNKADLKEKDQIFIFAYEVKQAERYGASQSYVHSISAPVQKSGFQKNSKKKSPKFFE